MSRLQTLWYHRMGGRRKHTDLDNPMFGEAGTMHEWRNYVGAYTRQIWETLDGEQRAAIAIDADERAGNEDWD